MPFYPYSWYVLTQKEEDVWNIELNLAKSAPYGACVSVLLLVLLPWRYGFLMTVYAFLCVGWRLASLIKGYVCFTRNYRCWIAVWRENCRGRKWQELDQWKLKIMSLVGLVLVRCSMSVFSLNWGIFVSLYQEHLVIFFLLFVAYLIRNACFGLHELCF